MGREIFRLNESQMQRGKIVTFPTYKGRGAKICILSLKYWKIANIDVTKLHILQILWMCKSLYYRVGKLTTPSNQLFHLSKTSNFSSNLCVCVCMQPKYGGTMFLDAFGPISKSITPKLWFLHDGVMITRLIWKTPLFEKWDERISGF